MLDTCFNFFNLNMNPYEIFFLYEQGFIFKFGNLNNTVKITRKFMTEHGIVYRYDPKNRMGCIQKMAKYSVWCVCRTFGTNYNLKTAEAEKEKNSKKKRRRELMKLPFDPKINLKDASKVKKILVKSEKEDDEEDDDNLKYIIEKTIVNKFEKHFEEIIKGIVSKNCLIKKL